MSLTLDELTEKTLNGFKYAGPKEKVNLTDNDFSFVADHTDYDSYLTSLRNGTFKLGLSTGIKSLDHHFLLKQGNLVIVNGHDNVGKSVIIWYLALLSSLYHGWKWIIFSSENSAGSFMRKMIEFYWCENITHLTDAQYRTAYHFVTAHFTLIRSEDELYNLRDVIKMAKKINTKKQHHALMIDPYNSLAINDKSTLSEHTYHYEALGVLKLFTKQDNVLCVLNCHAVTNALRQADSDGFPKPPGKADTEGGGKFAARADDFLTIHRLIQHSSDWNKTQIHVRKIKETETGGRTTPLYEPVVIESLPGLFGFIENNSITPRNPIIEFHNINRNNNLPDSLFEPAPF